jgi:hypothetical protein
MAFLMRVWDGLWHSFIYDDLPEAKDANNIIVHFFDKHLGRKALKTAPPGSQNRLSGGPENVAAGAQRR